MSQLKVGSDIPRFSKTPYVAQNYLKDNKHNSLHLTHARIFFLGHFLFLEAQKFAFRNIQAVSADNSYQIKADVYVCAF